MARRQQKRRTAAAPATPQRRPAARPRFYGARLHRRLHVLVRRRPLAVVAGLVVLHLLLAALTFEPRPHTGGDNAAYIALGRSLIENGTYTEVWDPEQAPHTKYPPVFPGVLGLAMLVGLQPWVQLKLVVIALSAVGIAFSFFWMRARRRPLLALGIATALAIAPGVLREGRWLLSDVPFWAFTMVALWAFERLRPGDRARFAIAALATLLAYFTRSAGLPLVLAALGWLAWRRRWPQLGGLAAIIGVPAVLWLLRTRAYGPSGYVSEFWLVDPYNPALGRIGVGDMVQRVLENVQKYLSIHLPQLLTTSEGGLLAVSGALIFGLAIAGWVWRTRRLRVADVFLPLYLGLIFIWPAVWSGERFLLPALPLLLFFAGEALVRLLRRYQPRLTFAIPAGAAALLMLAALPGLGSAVQVGRECTGRYLDGQRYPCMGGYWEEFFLLSERMSAMLPEDAVVLSRKPRLFYGLSGLRSAVFPFSDEPAAFFATVDSVGARYLLFDGVDALSQYYVRPVLLRRPAAFCVMRAERSGTVLFGIRPEHAAAPDLAAAGAAGQADISFTICEPAYWRSEDAMRTWGTQRP